MMASAVVVSVAVAVVVDNWRRYGITGKGGGVQLTMPVKDVEREDGHSRNREIRLLARPTEILTDQSTAVAIHGGVCNLWRAFASTQSSSPSSSQQQTWKHKEKSVGDWFAL